MTARDKPFTVADLDALQDLPENRDKRFELIGGIIFEMPTGTLKHAYIIGQIFGYLWQFVNQRRLGMVFPDGATYVLSDEDEFVPDVSFISTARFQGLGQKQYGPPDLAVEVISPSNHPLDMLFKIERYFHFGTQEVWLVYPDERVVYVYRPEPDGSLNLRKIPTDGTLTDSIVLPGFSLAIQSIFPTEQDGN